MLVEFKRSKTNFHCEDCGELIEKEEPYWYLEFETSEKGVYICEDCGTHLQNDMSDEFYGFVDLEK